MHALCKLPPHGLQGRRGKLSATVLRNRHQKWDSTHAVFIDEVSMVGKAQLHQCDVRIRRAKQEPLNRFGGIATVAAGDFMQLPPVDKSPPIDLPMDDAGTMPNKTTQSDGDTSDTDTEHVQAYGEQRHGHELWHPFTTIVFLTQNIRAKGILCGIQSDMRQK